MGSRWDHIGIDVESLWRHVEVTSVHLGPTLVLLWGRLGLLFGVKCKTQVLVAGNFKEHAMEKSNVEKWTEKGFRIGAIVRLKRRITITYGKKEDERRDVAKDTRGCIKGFADGDIVITFDDIKCGQKTKSIDWKVKADNLELGDGATSGSKPDGNAAPAGKHAAKYKFMESGDSKGGFEVVQGWVKTLMHNDDTYKATKAKTLAAFALDRLHQLMPKFGEDDLVVAKREGGAFEVWTLKDYKPGELKFDPYSWEIKPRHWTATRSVIVRHTDDRRPTVIDGRVRATPCHERYTFSLFWLITRIGNGESKAVKDKINMELTYTTAQLKMSFDINGKSFQQEEKSDDFPSIPILINPKAIKKHTMLTVKEDLDLKKLVEKLEKEKVTDSEKKRAADKGDETNTKKQKS